MTLREAYELAETHLYRHMPRLGELGWRVYTDSERRRLIMLANSLWAEHHGKAPFAGTKGQA